MGDGLRVQLVRILCDLFVADLLGDGGQDHRFTLGVAQTVCHGTHFVCRELLVGVVIGRVQEWLFSTILVFSWYHHHVVIGPCHDSVALPRFSAFCCFFLASLLVVVLVGDSTASF